MKWEYLGKQELKAKGEGMFGRDAQWEFRVWRAGVPGGWMLFAFMGDMTTYSTNLTFLPDPEHAWTGESMPQTSADYLLRPAGFIDSGDQLTLLRASEEPETTEGG